MTQHDLVIFRFDDALHTLKSPGVKSSKITTKHIFSPEDILPEEVDQTHVHFGKLQFFMSLFHQRGHPGSPAITFYIIQMSIDSSC